MAHLGLEQELPLSANALRVLEKRYLRRAPDGKPVERPKDMFARVARAVAEGDRAFDGAADIQETAAEFYRLMTSLEFLPNSPTLMNAGRELGQLSACFVLPVDDSMESIFESVKYTAMIHKSGGGTGFSFSRIRPKNDVVASTKGVSSGPVSFMKVFDAATETVKQGGTRRGANMGILRVDHPDILDFISCKTSEHALNNFNISVAATDAFMDAVQRGGSYELLNPRTNRAIRSLDARKVFDAIVKLSWKNGEPGIIFIDRINRDNPTPHVGAIESTNPCGEQPLLPYESCNLGSINLARMVRGRDVDWDKLKRTVHSAVHFLDNVIEVNRYPLPAIERVTKGNRKIGLGVMGYADMLIALGLPYASEDALRKGEEIMAFIRREARAASAELAETRGAFPNFRGSIYDRPSARPLRNATTTTVAPTGTISIIAGCSSGIEPLYGVCFVRNVLDKTELPEVNPLFEKIAREEGFYSEGLMRQIADAGSLAHVDGVPERWRRLFVTAHDITPEWHIRTQAAFQHHTDNAVSKTVNLKHEATESDVAEVFRLSYILGCKGVTVYRDGSRSEQVLSTGKTHSTVSSAPPPASDPGMVSERARLTPRERPEVVRGCTQKMTTGCGNLYVTVNEDDRGIFELFTAMGKAGGCASSQAEAISRLVSLALRAGVDPEAIIKQLSGVRCPSPAWKDGEMILSCADAIARALKRYVSLIRDRTTPVPSAGSSVVPSQPPGAGAPSALPVAAQVPEAEAASHPVSAAPKSDPPASPDARPKAFLACPDCGGTVEHLEGCLLCPECGYSKCG
ncbi:MAG: vitamin B12-dependent ribonucleotide reductase [Myxococcales bacterium]|nr:vitamin B12-dependent ribonucleotide reductase [Myxococcales bacterium]